MVSMSESQLPAIKPPTLYRPIWADPGFILSTNDYSLTDFEGALSPDVVIAKNNPKRWAIGFLPAIGTTIGWTVGPWNDPQTFGIKLSDPSEIKWFTLFDFGPLVCVEWYGHSDNSSNIRVIEIEIG